MKSEWKTKSIGELTKYISKGIAPKYTDEMTDNTVYVLNQKCNRNFKISYSEARFHDLAQKTVPKEKILCLGDVLVNSTGTGTAGRVAQITDIPYTTTVDGHMIIMRPTNEIEPFYYGYAIKTIQSKIETFAEGSTGQTEINRQRLCDEIFISYPVDKEMQHQISSLFFFFFHIDKKIAINTKINENLEQHISEYFKSAFPDVLNPTGTDTLEKIISFSNGKKRPNEIGNIPVFGGNGILAYTNKSNSSNCVIIGRVGAYCGNVSLSLGDCWISDNAISAKSKITESQLFIFNLLKNAALPNRHIGTGQPLMTQGILNSILCNIPTIKKINDFESSVIPLQSLVSANIVENQHLVALRDTLLPKLMNGEIDVSTVKI